ncbi:hypothetical protein cypCar_00024660 [Cyprinus carpio]|nr:hypothetical protein cypCar_00024660 [Cyprinus carpio]
MKSEVAEDVSAGLASQEDPLDALSEVTTKESPEEAEEDVAGGSDSSERAPLGCVPVAACCVCLELERVSNCIRSEKICILPILACLLSLALCTAGLKWVFVDKIFEYDPPTHLDPKRIGQDPIISSDFTQNSALVSPSTVTPATPSIPGQPKIFVEGDSTAKTFEVHSTKVPVFTPTAAVTVHTNSVSPPSPKSTFKPIQNGTANQYPSQTLESKDIVPKTFLSDYLVLTTLNSVKWKAVRSVCKMVPSSVHLCVLLICAAATGTTPTAKTSSHVTRCSERERNYCVNGGECFTLEVTPGTIRRLCRCPNEFTGDRCQNYVMASFYKHLGIEFMEAEELYQKRVLTITGICIALLVVGIMCVVAYCKTNLRAVHVFAHVGNRGKSCMIVCGRVYESETLRPKAFSSPTLPPKTCSWSIWSNGKAESVVSDSHAVLVKSSVENCQHGTSGHRGRLNASGGVHQLSDHLKSSRETQGSCRDSPYSERYVSAMTTPSRLSPVGLLSPATPSSPPSEMSAPLSSLATSVPSMAMSPSGEEECPLLFLRDKSGLKQSQKSGHNLRNSAHYNHGLELPSPPASPLHIVEHEEYESAQQYQSTAAASAPSSPPHSPTAGPRSSRTQPSGQTGPAAALEPVSGSNSESSSSESETEDERVEEETPFLGLQNPLAAGSVVLDGLEGSRTNPALLLSPQHDLQSRLTAVMVNQDPIAV